MDTNKREWEEKNGTTDGHRWALIREEKEIID